MSIIKYQYKLAAAGVLALSVASLLTPTLANAALVNGEATISINNPVFETTTVSGFYPNGVVLTDYYDSSFNNTSLFPVPTTPSTASISPTSNNQNLVFPVNGSSVTPSTNPDRYPQNTTMDTGNTSIGQIGLTGALIAKPQSGAGTNFFQDMSLLKINNVWNLVTHDTTGGGGETLFQLTNVSENVGTNGLSLSGDLIFGNGTNSVVFSTPSGTPIPNLAPWVNFLQIAAGSKNTVVGHLNLTPSAVPVPAAVWLFGSAMAGLVGYRRKSAGLAA